jgi:hypothetical protein
MEVKIFYHLVTRYSACYIQAHSNTGVNKIPVISIIQKSCTHNCVEYIMLNNDNYQMAATGVCIITLQFNHCFRVISSTYKTGFCKTLCHVIPAAASHISCLLCLLITPLSLVFGFILCYVVHHAQGAKGHSIHTLYSLGVHYTTL